MKTLHFISKSALLDRELRCQGSSLQTWAEQRGLCVRSLRNLIDLGVEDAIVHELAETLGVSVTALKPTGT